MNVNVMPWLAARNPVAGTEIIHHVALFDLKRHVAQRPEPLGRLPQDDVRERLLRPVAGEQGVVPRLVVHAGLEEME